MKKVVIHVLLFLAIILINAECIDTGGADKRPEGTTTLKVMWWGGQIRHDKTLKVIEMYEQQNPNVNIEAIYMSWDGYWEKLPILAASNEMPDVVQMVIQHLPQYAEKNLLADLNKVKTLDVSDMDMIFRELGSVNGKLLGITLGANAPCLIYNKDLFDQASASYPRDNWTWDDYEKAANQIHHELRIEGIVGTNSIISDYNDFEVFARENGETLYSHDNMVGFTQKTLEKFMTRALRMIKAGSMEPMKVTREFRSNEENTPYANGQTAMMFLWSNKIIGVRKTLGRDSEIVVYPGPDSLAKGMYIKPGSFFSVARSSKHQDEAGKFIDFFVNNLEANLVLNAEYGVPAFPKVRNALLKNADSQNKKIFEYIDKLGKQAGNPMDTNFPTKDRAVKLKMRDIMEEVGLGRVSATEGAHKIIYEWNTVLSKIKDQESYENPTQNN